MGGVSAAKGADWARKGGGDICSGADWIPAFILIPNDIVQAAQKYAHEISGPDPSSPISLPGTMLGVRGWWKYLYSDVVYQPVLNLCWLQYKPIGLPVPAQVRTES